MLYLDVMQRVYIYMCMYRYEQQLESIIFEKNKVIDDTNSTHVLNIIQVTGIKNQKETLLKLERDKELTTEQMAQARDSMEELSEERKRVQVKTRHALEKLNRNHKSTENHRKLYEIARKKKIQVAETIPITERHIKEIDEQIADLRKQTDETLELRLREIKNDEELFISQFLGQLKLEEDTQNLLDGVAADQAAYEKKILVLGREERAKQQVISEMTAQRQLMARELSRATAQHKSTKEELKIKNLILDELDKQVIETFSRLTKCSSK